jgi:hypothetical protein
MIRKASYIFYTTKWQMVVPFILWWYFKHDRLALSNLSNQIFTLWRSIASD